MSFINDESATLYLNCQMFFLIERSSWNCLSNVGHIPPYDKVRLQTTFAKLNHWAMGMLRKLVMEADTTLSEQGTLEQPSNQSRQHIPNARFILALIGLLASDKPASGVSQLLNSGVIGLLQTILRLTGKTSKATEWSSL